MTKPDRAMIGLFLRVALRLAMLIAIIYGAVHLSDNIRQSLQFEILSHNETAIHRAIILGVLAYILLTALPFVPGAEIGMAMLTLLGASIAPLVYLATILSLCLAFVIGRLIPPNASAAALRRIGLRKAGKLIADISLRPKEERLEALVGQIDKGAVKLAARYRYVLLAMLINMPGNIVFGGGGGIAIVAGLCRVFAPLPYLLTVAIAVLPVPLAVLMMAP